MTARNRLVRRACFIGIAAFLAAGVIAPFVQIKRGHERIRTALQNALHRKVQMGAVHFSIFNGPGFSVDKVLIEEDPSIGLEPFAYVATLDARVRLSSLWLGRLEFSTLTLDRPSVNLVKVPNGSWNVMPLLQQVIETPSDMNAGNVSSVAGGRLPTIQIRSGRINFKFGDRKSPFYFTGARVDFAPQWGDTGAFDVRFSGEPARTDRTAQGFGTVTGRGQWIQTKGAESRLELALEMEKTAIDEVSALFQGRTFGLHGLMASRATVKGPISNLQVAGRVQLEDIHRWDLMPSAKSGGWQLYYRGVVDWKNQRIELTANPAESGSGPLALRFRLLDFMASPHWAADLTVDGLPASSLIEVSRHMGVPFPNQIGIDGKVVGVLAYASASGMQGTLALENTAVDLGGESHLNVRKAELSLDGMHIHLEPAEVTADDGQAMDLSGDYDLASQALDVTLKGRAVKVAELQAGSGHLLSAASVPLMERFRKGTWTGSMHYRISQGEPGVWSGNVELHNAQTMVPGIAEPLSVSSANVEIDGARVAISRLRAHAGKISFDGEYRYEPDQVRQHRFRLVVPTLDTADLEQVLLPSLRRDAGFLARTLRLRSAETPDWLRERHADGTIRIGTLTAGPLEFRAVRARAIWDGTRVDLTGVDAMLEDAKVKGSIGIDIAGTLPKYAIKGQVDNLSWKNGRVDFDAAGDTQGMGADFLANLHTEGNFQARSIAVLPDNPLRTASGSYEFSFGVLGPRIKLTSLQASVGTEHFSGQGDTLADGKLQLELASTSRLMRFSGPLLPLRLDITLTRLIDAENRSTKPAAALK